MYTRGLVSSGPKININSKPPIKRLSKTSTARPRKIALACIFISPKLLTVPIIPHAARCDRMRCRRLGLSSHKRDRPSYGLEKSCNSDRWIDFQKILNQVPNGVLIIEDMVQHDFRRRRSNASRSEEPFLRTLMISDPHLCTVPLDLGMAAAVGVPAWYSALRENKLPHPHSLSAKSTSAALQVQFPHAAKRVVVFVFQFIPPGIEPLEPRHQKSCHNDCRARYGNLQGQGSCRHCPRYLRPWEIPPPA